MKRVIFPAALAVAALAWSGAALADDPSTVADDTAKKAGDAADKTSDAAKKTSDSAKKATDSAKKSTSDAASKSTDSAKKTKDDATKAGSSTKSKAQDSAKKSTDAADDTADNVTSAADDAATAVQTTAANIFQMDSPEKTGLPNKVLLGTSLGVLALAYVPSAIVGIASPKGTDAWMALPVAGPWIALGTGSDERQWTGDLAIIASGVVQGVSTLGVVASFVVPDHKLPVGMNSKLRVAPTQMGQGGYGIGAGGTF